MNTFQRNIYKLNNTLPNTAFRVYLESLITSTANLSSGGGASFSGNTLTSSSGTLHVNTSGIVSFNGFKIDFTETFGEVGILEANSETYASFQPETWLGHKAGELVPTILSTAPTGWIMYTEGTIGNDTSGATIRSAFDCESLFVKLWNKYDDTQCPVSGGRGSSGSNDFAALKTITLPAITGRVVAVSGNGTGLTIRTDYMLAGTASHTMTIAEMYKHAHATINEPAGGTLNPNPQTYYGFKNGYDYTFRLTDSVLHSWPSVTAGTGRSNIENTIYINFMIKL